LPAPTRRTNASPRVACSEKSSLRCMVRSHDTALANGH
jgi:hypothetical protein